MKLTLSENIRMFRKQRKLTQEKLAEALGVTVGAVYKWESGLSQPELSLIVELADFFDVSVDVLLGYRMKDNSIQPILERLDKYCRTLDPAALGEAEKALTRYPHSFEMVYGCAQVYLAFGTGNRDPDQLRRSLELMEQARVLLPQSSDPRINESLISGGMATAWFLLGKKEKALELMEKNNAGGTFSSSIGAIMSVYMGRYDEAVPYLSEAMQEGILSLFNAALGYFFVFLSRGDWKSALDITEWVAGLYTGLKTEDRPDFLDKAMTMALSMRAFALKKAGKAGEAYAALKEAAEMAVRFDSTPDFTLKTLRFADYTDRGAVLDVFGASAVKSVAEMIGRLNEQDMSEKWKELTDNGRQD